MATSVQARPQVGIERLPAANLRRGSNEQREAMNCKSCRKRKIKCNRLRPKCEACKIFQCACLYDAVPKKRGPKTEVLESLLKRVDELEKKLPNEKSNAAPGSSSQSEDENKPDTGIPAPPINNSTNTVDSFFAPLPQRYALWYSRPCTICLLTALQQLNGQRCLRRCLLPASRQQAFPHFGRSYDSTAAVSRASTHSSATRNLCSFCEVLSRFSLISKLLIDKD